MSRVNSWLLRRLDKLPEPAPLPPKLEEMRLTVERRISRTLCVALLAFGGVSLSSEWLLSLRYGVLVFVPLALLVVFVVNVAMAYNSRAAVRDYTTWLAAQHRARRRITRVGIPYERQPPTASTACLDCPAQPGQRHARSCPSVPPEWFNRGR